MTKINDVISTLEKADEISRYTEVKRAIEELEEIEPFVINGTSILDAAKVECLKRMYQNLNIEQLEEVENFAKSLVKHPSKYIDFIHED